MSTFKISVGDMINLSTEVSVFLGENISLALKYKLTKFLKRLSEHTKPALEQRDEIIKKLAPDGMTIKNKLEDGTDNPLMKEFNEQFKQITTVEENLTECPEIALTDLEVIKSQNNYPLLYNFLLKENP